MKAELETEKLAFRGVLLTSETKEEKEMIESLWNRHGRPVMMGRHRDGNVHIVIAPTPKGTDPNEGTWETLGKHPTTLMRMVIEGKADIIGKDEKGRHIYRLKEAA